MLETISIDKLMFNVKNKTMTDLNNENNIILQEKNNNIEIYYISKEYKSTTDENILKKAKPKITIQQEDEKYYIYFNKNIDNKKEVKKEDLKDFIKNIKNQENYIDINKIKKITLKDLE